MTSPAIPSPKGEELRQALVFAERIANFNPLRDGDFDDDWAEEAIFVARALLSTSSREEVLREALERISWNEPEGTPAQREATAALSQGE